MIAALVLIGGISREVADLAMLNMIFKIYQRGGR